MYQINNQPINQSIVKIVCTIPGVEGLLSGRGLQVLHHVGEKATLRQAEAIVQRLELLPAVARGHHLRVGPVLRLLLWRYYKKNDGDDNGRVVPKKGWRPNFIVDGACHSVLRWVVEKQVNRVEVFLLHTIHGACHQVSRSVVEKQGKGVEKFLFHPVHGACYQVLRSVA